MSNYDMIFKRKSTRRFLDKNFSQDLVNEINAYIKELIPSKTGINIDAYFLENEKIRGFFKVKAPYYVAITSETKEDYDINVGFILEQLVLWLTEKGISTCWLGACKPNKKICSKFKLEYVTMIACGYSEELEDNNIRSFNRKEIEEICIGESNSYIEAARVAPSAMNKQPWKFIVKNDFIHVYCEKVSGLFKDSKLKSYRISVGIALCHMFENSKNKDEKIEFIKQEESIELINKFEYIISIKIA